MRWPSGWKDPSTLDLLRGTAIDYLLIGGEDDLAKVRKRAQQVGLRILQAPPPGIEMVNGVWPGVNLRRGGGGISAGPTGNPWVDSNGWAVRLAAAFHPGAAVWVDAPPAQDAVITSDSYLVAVADSAAHGGRWIITLDRPLADDLAGGRSEALATWKSLAAACGFFAEHKSWPACAPLAVVGVVSDFAGANEFFSHELLNLLARAGGHYRILPKGGISAGSFEALRAVIYPDAEPPAPTVRKQVLTFVASGGMLITGPPWSDFPNTRASATASPRFSVYPLGNGKIAAAHAAPDDPYAWANDTIVLVSHRYDLVRLWNSGAAGSYCTISPDRKKVVAHLVFYADRGPDSAAVRIAGRYRAVKASTVEQPDLKVGIQLQADAVEVHLPAVSQYVALELEI